ncbi:hypothetical protein [Streptomyces sp. HNM0575]|uniref:hypothetical protein n=1 Tax=Streptomyces sp. HNM0575 TaxID=2716338 RepID=UPI0019CF950D|nr:hypothetical protein [Streptomyces sp. HNM0575]
MVRNLLGVLLALAGAALAVWSPFNPWYAGRLGRDYRTGELFGSTGITGTQAALWTGLFVPMLAAAVLTLLAVLLRSRLLVALAGLVVLGFAILWMVRQGQQAGTLTAGAGGLGEGSGYAIGGGALLLMGALVMRGRRRRGRRRKGRRGGHHDDGRAVAVPPGDETYGDDYGGEYGGEHGGEYGSEHSEMPRPYGPFGTADDTGDERGAHGAYLADTGPGGPPYGQPPGRPHGGGRDPYGGGTYGGRDPYEDDSTPPQEWDPWAAGAPAPPPDIPPALNEPHGSPPGDSADQAPQGPQRQPPAGPDDEGPGPHDSHRLRDRPDHRGGGTGR